MTRASRHSKRWRRNSACCEQPARAAWLGERERRDEAALVEVIERGTVRGSTIRGTQRGRMLQKIERADELAREVAELKSAMTQLRAECRKDVTELKVGLAEKNAELKAVRANNEAKTEKLQAKVERLEEKLARRLF